MTKIIKPRTYIRHPAKIFNASAGGGFRKCLFSEPAMTLFYFTSIILSIRRVLPIHTATARTAFFALIFKTDKLS